MKTIIIIVELLASMSLAAQENISSILFSIEENNTKLKALKEEMKAQKLGNKTGIYLSDPDVAFGYLWGTPSNIGTRKDFSVTQTFDIPTITGMKSRLANNKNQLVELQYASERINLLLEAKQYAIDLIYYNGLKKELEIRLRHAQTIADAYKQRLDRGDASILEYNKVQLNLSTVQGEMSRVEVERNTLLSELKRLNGGIEILLEENNYSPASLPADFEEWYLSAEQKNPLLQYVKQQIEVSRKEVKLNKAMRFPKFSAGYSLEKTLGQKYQGANIGISIPLWENKNRVKQAKAGVIAAQTREQESKQQFYNRLQNLYMRANGLQQTAAGYRKSLQSLNNTDLLMKALDVGEINLLNYIVEIGLYYDTVNQTLAAERDFEKALADLSAVEL
ncbi:TolC family protein [Bacteroides fragilis]|uniref:TolC family protein n=1 Tax=Bacteroides fragilis TaxID=817 RepID=UPI00202E6B1E|nr:TolC family protein [Bacteroides fragilis]MCM0245408.1 TolC family protein [Bacteroides fragilis]MCM0253936.1 TolC family protein [Bacteroides fragilis]